MAIAWSTCLSPSVIKSLGSRWVQDPIASTQPPPGGTGTGASLALACSLMCTCFPDTGLNSVTVSVTPLPGRGPVASQLLGGGVTSVLLSRVVGGHSQLPVTSSKGIFLQYVHFVIVTLASFISSSTVSVSEPRLKCCIEVCLMP